MELNIFKKLFFLTLITFHLPCAFAQEAEVCVYKDEHGVINQVSNKQDIPANYRTQAKCLTQGQNSYLAEPEKVSLGNNVREENFQSSLGKISLRWPRSAETIFNRSPLRAVNDAVETIARAVKTAAFPSFVQQMNADWKIVFIDQSSPAVEIPSSLIKNCHPGWMTPPANIYIVANIIGGSCENEVKSKGVTDADLTRVLLHEFGHVVELQLLRDAMAGDKLRAEGFATWFELFSSKFSSIVRERELRAENISLAKQTLTKGAAFKFQGTAPDYARAALYFDALASKKGISALMQIYRSIALENLDFFQAVKEKSYWNREQLEKEVSNIIGDEK